jgi:3-phenylpropionate/trans-cinnamate dioxygenase ferredoxin subunit
VSGATGYVALGVADLAPGTVALRRAGAVDVLLARAQDGQYHAVAPLCSHAALSLEGGRVRGSSIVCPHHGARFCLRTGRVLGAPAVLPIAAYPTRMAGDMVEAWPV